MSLEIAPSECPNCHGQALWASERISAGAGKGADLLPGLGSILSGGGDLIAVVCRACGLARYFVHEDSLSEIDTSARWRRLPRPEVVALVDQRLLELRDLTFPELEPLIGSVSTEHAFAASGASYELALAYLRDAPLDAVRVVASIETPEGHVVSRDFIKDSGGGFVDE